jgi:integrase
MKTLKDAFLQKYPKYASILLYFEEATNAHATWESVTKSNLSDFAAFLKERVSQSSARTYCAMLKGVINLYKEEAGISSEALSKLNVKKDVSQNVFLTESEIKRIVDYVPRSDSERYVRNTFLIGCLTGARHSDYDFFSNDNIVDGYLVYVSQKTKIEARVPVSPLLVRLLEERMDIVSENISISDMCFNETIRSICRKCNIFAKTKIYQAGRYQDGAKWEFVASHTARRSFVTNLYLRGADLYSISKLAGHSSSKQTESYICCGLRTLSDRVLSYFNVFDNPLP